MSRVEVVGAVIVNTQGEILCARRSERMSQPGLWEFPGGKVEAGEDPRDSLRREIREELTCEVVVSDVVADVVHPYPTVEVHLTTYWVRIVSGWPAATEHAELKWVAVAQLAALQWAAADIPTVRRLTSTASRRSGFDLRNFTQGESI